MSVSSVRFYVAFAMTLLLPLSLSAADGASAILHSTGGVWVNGTEAPDATAIFAGDSIETKPGFVANLDVSGTSVLIQGESIVQFESDFVTLEHGSVEVGTGTQFSVRVNCIEVKPIIIDRTQYDVTDLSGRVDVSALKDDVTIRHNGRQEKARTEVKGESDTVHEGHQDTRYEAAACGAAKGPESPTSPFNAKPFEIGGGVAAGAIALCLLLCKGKSSPSISPDGSSNGVQK